MKSAKHRSREGGAQGSGFTPSGLWSSIGLCPWRTYLSTKQVNQDLQRQCNNHPIQRSAKILQRWMSWVPQSNAGHAPWHGSAIISLNIFLINPGCGRTLPRSGVNMTILSKACRLTWLTPTVRTVCQTASSMAKGTSAGPSCLLCFLSFLWEPLRHLSCLHFAESHHWQRTRSRMQSSQN